MTFETVFSKIGKGILWQILFSPPLAALVSLAGPLVFGEIPEFFAVLGYLIILFGVGPMLSSRAAGVPWWVDYPKDVPDELWIGERGSLGEQIGATSHPF